MSDRIQKSEIARRLAERMDADEKTATEWIDGFVDTIYECLATGESVTIRGFGNFYVRQERSAWVFKFNPAQRFRTLFNWS